MGAMGRIKKFAKPLARPALTPLRQSLLPDLVRHASYWPHGDGVGSYSRPAWPPTARAADGFPVPPPELRALYGTTEDAYLASGQDDCESMEKILAESGVSLAGAGSILDLGCAAGRMIRHIPAMAPGTQVWGADIWSSAILWCQDHLRPPCNFVVNTRSPHLPFEDRSFGLVYCGSLFTQIDDLTETWFAELRRILRPGGHLYFSILDQHTVPLIEGKGDPSRYFARWASGQAYWDSYVAKMTRHPDYQRFRRGDAYMIAVEREVQANHVMWDTEVLCDRLSWGYRRLSVNPLSWGQQTTVLLERI